MGCANSKLDNLPAVALCRDRCKFLDQSLLSTHALLHSHSAYTESLNTLPTSLLRFFNAHSSFHLSPSSSHSDSQPLSEDVEFEMEKTHTLHSPNFFFSNFDLAGVQSPPPPPISSSWDFLNFFDTFERFEPVWDRQEKVAVKECVSKAHKKPDAKKSDQSEKKNDSRLGVYDVMREIKASFEKASESANGISNLLSYGQIISISKDGKASSRGLSSTLKKLCIWEQKLYLEVKAEERLRLALEKKCRQLKYLVEKKTDARKVDSVRTQIGDLSIKLKVSIQVVDRISITISKLRDEEFLAEITELIHGLCCMWKAMLDCHKNQSQILTEARDFDALFNEKLDDVHLEAAMELKLELQNWRTSFCNWISTQKNCVKALNGWLLRFLLYEPGQPFSPERIGAPPVFIICNHWSETMDKFSDKEVSEAINVMICSVDQLLKQHEEDLQRMAMANKDLEKKMKGLDIGEQKTKKLNQALGEKTVAVAAESLYKSTIGADMKSGLKQTFSALTRFSADSIKAFEELRATMADKQPVP